MVKIEIKSVSRLNKKEVHDETAYINSSPQMVEILERGDKEIEAGKGTTVKLEDLWNHKKWGCNKP